MSYRSRISLDGTWQFQIDPAGHAALGSMATMTAWREATVPLPWQAQFDDLRHTSGVAWYRRTFTLNETPSGAAILHFGAVDYQATVWLNDHRVGEHEGGYLPFEFDVAPLLRRGQNDLAVRVADPDENPERWPAYPFSEIPHGKQSWYGPISGIWQSVWLELRSEAHIGNLRLTPRPGEAAIDVLVRLGGAPPSVGATVQLSVFDHTDTEVASGVADAQGEYRVQLDSAVVEWWSPDSPVLYTVWATLMVGDQPVDETSAACGFRTVEARDGRIYLNGKPIYLRGVLDQAYYPETIYTPPSTEFLEDQMRKAKALGLNCLRCHIKVEDPRYYEVADRLGILIWTEIPNWNHLSAEASHRGKLTFSEMVERDWNHPSIFAWTLINENWGTDLTHNAEHRRWLAEFYREAKAIDPTRLIVDNSACGGNAHVVGDLDDYHHYRAIPDHAQEWDEWVADFARRAEWAWYDDYRDERRPDLPLIVSEFGNWGLPDPRKIQEKGKDPWWFETGYDWGDGIVYPHAMRQRFDNWGLADVFGSFEGFIHAHQEHMARSLAYEISTMRLHTNIGGYVITEFTDVHWECNGLMDMRRNVKQGLNDLFVPLNQDRVVVVRPKRWGGRPGESVSVLVHTVDVNGDDGEGTIHWVAVGASGRLSAPGGMAEVPLTAQGLVALNVRWLESDGALIAQAQVGLACVESPSPRFALQVMDDPALAASLRHLGYPLVQGGVDSGAALIVARHYTRGLQTAVQQGARLLLLAGTDFHDAPDSAPLHIGRVVSRAGTPWQGDWATSYSWLKKTGPFAHLPGSPLLAMEYADIMPDAVLAGVPAWTFRHHTWAGLALGWVHKPVALITKAPYGKGLLTISTFNLSDSILADDSIAQALLGGLVELTAM